MSAYKLETLQLHIGQETPDSATVARAVSIYATTFYVFRDRLHAAARFGFTDAGNIYGRLTNSTHEGLEKRIAAWTAIELAKRPENEGKTIVVLLPDTGDRYLSTPLLAE